MKKTLLYKQLRIAKFNKNLAIKTAKHSLLLDEEKNILQNRITAKSDQNRYKFRGKLISNIDDRTSALSYIDSLFNNDNNNFDSVKFSKTKYKFKKWIDSDKTPKPEVNLFKKLILIIENHQDKEINLAKTLKIFHSSSHKVKRFNDKQNAITDLVNLHNERVSKDIDQASQLNIRLIEVLFKVPEHNNQPISAEVQEDILQNYFSDNFPDFELFLTVIHNDEIVPHVHGFIDGLNNKTQLCDFVEQQYQYIRSKNWLFDYPEKYSACSSKQVKKIGEWLQQDFYDFTNRYLLKHGYSVEFAIKELTEEEQDLRRTIKTNNAKRMADREYNTANYLANRNAEYFKEKVILEAELSSLETKIKKLKSHIESALNYAIEFAKSALPFNLIKFHQHHDNLAQLDKTIAQKVKNEAVKLQPNLDQKEQIKRNKIYKTKN